VRAEPNRVRALDLDHELAFQDEEELVLLVVLVPVEVARPGPGACAVERISAWPWRLDRFPQVVERTKGAR
jgi:hypothetical protein